MSVLVWVLIIAAVLTVALALVALAALMWSLMAKKKE